MSATSERVTYVKKTHVYSLGYDAGAQDGYKKGYKAGDKDLHEYGRKGVLRKIPHHVTKPGWSKNYNARYSAGFKDEYIISYQNARFSRTQLF